MISILLYLFCLTWSTNAQNCGELTTQDVEGPFFVENVPLDSRIVTDAELRDGSQATLLKGRVVDKNCRGLAGATIDVWYAGGGTGSGYMMGLLSLRVISK